MVRRIADGLQPIIGLQAVPEGERYNEPNQIDDVSTASFPGIVIILPIASI